MTTLEIFFGSMWLIIGTLLVARIHESIKLKTEWIEEIEEHEAGL